MTSRDRAAANPSATSGREAGRNASGKVAGGTGRSVAELDAEFGNLFFTLFLPNSADMYIRTQERLADVAGMLYGPDIYALVKDGTEADFPEPEAPADQKPSPFVMERFKKLLAICYEQREKYKRDKHSVFILTKRRCTDQVLQKLKADPDYAQLEKDWDVAGLLKKLESYACSTDSIQHPYWTLQVVLRKLISMNQGPTESLTNYQTRFKAADQVFRRVFGDLVPTQKLKPNATKQQKAEATAKLKTMIFLNGVDKKRYGSLLDDWNNGHLAGQDLFPTSINEAVLRLQNHHDHKTIDGHRAAGAPTTTMEHSFVQGRARSEVRCFQCNEPGHVRDNCPHLVAIHEGSDTATDRSAIRNRRSTSGRRRPEDENISFAG